MTFKNEVTLKQPENIVPMLLGSKKSIEDMEKLQAFLKGYLAGKETPDRFIEYHEINLAETITEMIAFNKLLEESPKKE